MQHMHNTNYVINDMHHEYNNVDLLPTGTCARHIRTEMPDSVLARRSANSDHICMPGASPVAGASPGLPAYQHGACQHGAYQHGACQHGASRMSPTAATCAG